MCRPGDRTCSPPHRVLADPMRMETYGRLGVERVRHNYTRERIAALTEAVYMRLGRRRPGKAAT